ncbi:MAG TPA: hypothetical protein VFY66_01375, partial [Anaerolineales bacterium]|nr:hypothetical protein [Anaerolineales bacterium]
VSAGSGDLPHYQANLMPTSRFKKDRQNPGDSLREVVYVDVLSIVRDKMSRGTRACQHSSWLPGE